MMTSPTSAFFSQNCLHCKGVAKELTQLLISSSNGHLKAMGNIPRLYRRTNKEVPTKPSSYVFAAFKLITLFKLEFDEKVNSGRMRQWMTEVIT
jgi:hypothetical protein